MEGVEYEYKFCSANLDRNYADESYAYQIIEAENGFFFEINIYKDADGFFTGNGHVVVYANRGYFEDDVEMCRVIPEISYGQDA